MELQNINEPLLHVNYTTVANNNKIYFALDKIASWKKPDSNKTTKQSTNRNIKMKEQQNMLLCF